MAIDPPYGLDFLFSEITDVHFTSVWCGLFGFADVERFPGESKLANANVDVSFPEFAGGTPGFALVNPGGTIAGPSVKTLTSRDLTGSIRAGAGKGFTGFTMGYTDPLTPSGWNQYGGAMFACSGSMADKFAVKADVFHHDTLVGFAGVRVVLWKALKVGDRFIFTGADNPPFQIPTPAPGADASDSTPFNGLTTFNFTVDPKNLTVTED